MNDRNSSRITDTSFRSVISHNFPSYVIIVHHTVLGTVVDLAEIIMLYLRKSIINYRNVSGITTEYYHKLWNRAPTFPHLFHPHGNYHTLTSFPPPATHFSTSFHSQRLTAHAFGNCRIIRKETKLRKQRELSNSRVSPADLLVIAIPRRTRDE